MAKKSIIEIHDYTFEVYKGKNSGHGCFVWKHGTLMTALCANFWDSAEESLVEAVWKTSAHNATKKSP